MEHTHSPADIGLRRLRAVRARRCGGSTVAGLLVALAALAVLGLPSAAVAHGDEPHGSDEPDAPVVTQPDAPGSGRRDVSLPDTQRAIAIVELSGLIDPINDAYLREQLRQAAHDRVHAMVIQVDSTGATIDDRRLASLLQAVDEASFPIGVWVGPSGAQALGAAAHLATVADFAAVASPGSRLGDFTPIDGYAHRHRTASDAALASVHSHDRDAGHNPPDGAVRSADDAVSAGLAALASPSIGEFIFALEDAGWLEPVSEIERVDDGPPQRVLAPDVVVTFAKLPLVEGLFHTAASPAVAYLLLLVGLSMLMLDFFTGGIGVAGVVGVLSLLLAAYGLAVLDVRWWALAALVGSFAAFAVDLQTGVPRFWSAVGVLLAVVGTLALYRTHSMSWIPMVVGLPLQTAFVFSAMPSLIRTRYGTPTVGRDWMIGLEGTAVSEVNPEGTVLVKGAQWRARVNRLTPILAGEPLRVAAIVGVVLEVEPLEGAAVDYRQLRSSGSDADPESASRDAASADLEQR